MCCNLTCLNGCIRRRGFQRGLEAREPLVPDLLTDSGKDGIKQLQRADRVGAERDDHRRVPARLVESNGPLCP